jgi:hypothetical protein
VLRTKVCAIAVIMMITAIAACSGPAARSQPIELAWTRVELPPDVAPSRLSTDSHSLAIGGRQGTGPWIGVLAGDQLRPVPLQPNSPYAHTAEIVSLGISGSRIAALGNIRGGAHGNSRWTSWSGDTGEVVDLPQSLDVFGGTSGGDLVDIMINSDAVVIAGSRRFSVGLDPAVWLPDGKTWALQPSPGTALDSTDELLLSVRRGTAEQHQMILVGSATELTDGVRQRAVAWVQDDPWRRIDLPRTGGRSEATSVACTPDDATIDCLISGSVDGKLAVWRLTDGAARLTGLPDVSAAPDTPAPRSLKSGRLQAIAYDTGSGTGLAFSPSGRDGAWRPTTTPPGRLVDATALGRSCFLLTEHNGQRELWRARLDDG